jgi:hypothetical protein
MPWCEECSKYWAPSTMTADGRCPTCGRELEAPQGRDDEAEDADEGAPWHFKLLIAALVVYLVWRFYQLFFG